MDQSRLDQIVDEVLKQEIPIAKGQSNETPLVSATENRGTVKKVAIGSDHGGFRLKEELVKFLRAADYEVKDVGTFDENPVDYPDFAWKVARAVVSGDCDRGIVVDGAGIGSCMAANKVKGIRAAMCYDITTARNSREHNHANVLTLGGRMIKEDLAKEIVTVWLSTPFGGGRHWPRVNKIMEIERRKKQ